LPLPEFIEELYIKHFKKSRPEHIHTIEQMVNDYNKKRRERKTRRLKEEETDQSGREEVRNSENCLFSLHGGAFSRLIVFSDPPQFPAKWMTSCHPFCRIKAKRQGCREALREICALPSTESAHRFLNPVT